MSGKVLLAGALGVLAALVLAQLFVLYSHPSMVIYLGAMGFC